MFFARRGGGARSALGRRFSRSWESADPAGGAGANPAPESHLQKEPVSAASFRILIVLSGLHGGGSQRRLLRLAQGFGARGHQVEIAVGSLSGEFADRVPEGVGVVALIGKGGEASVLRGSKSLRMAAAIPPLASYLSRSRPDVVLASANPANLAALVARRLARWKPAVVVCINVPVSRAVAVRGRFLLGRFLRRWYRAADAVIVNARALADDVVGFAGVEPARVKVIANPIAVDEIRSSAAATVAHPWLNGDGPPVVLAVGKLKAQKDFETLIRAFAEVRRQRTARLLVLGEGEEKPKLRKLARELGIAVDVELAGFAPNPFAYMARAAVLVSTSRWEGFSNVVAEALACGCPVVATDCPGGTRDLLDDGRYGRLVPVGDVAAIARAVTSTLEEAPDRDVLRARAEAFPVHSAVEGYLEVLAQCLRERRVEPR